MKHIIILATTIALAAPAAAETPMVGFATGPALKREATVTGELVRIGDLVENAGAVAQVPIFRAPDLGQTGSVPASRVAEAVRSHHILQLDTRGIAEVTVTRASRAITPKEIETRIVRALATQYRIADTNDLTLIFDNNVRSIHVEPMSAAELAFARSTFEPRSGRFDVTLELSGGGRRIPLRYTGTLTETFETAVPMRPIAQGEILKASDLVVERRPKAEFTSSTVNAVDQASGLAARRALRPGQVLRQADLVKPQIVARNEAVTIYYEVPGIVLTIRGQALEAGAMGDVIGVLNVQTKRTLQATVTAHGRVAVGAPPGRLASNGAAPALASNSSNPPPPRAE